MEEDQELKHVCKFCSKSFPCGRSLGGHMRSHFTNGGSSIDHQTEKMNKNKKKKKKKNPSSLASSETGYGLRQNPKRTWRLNDWNEEEEEEEEEEEAMVFENVCKECGKGFQSLKALFGHMKCHSEKERVLINHSFDDQDSWNNNNNNVGRNQKVVMMDSQSDSEATTTAPNRRKRSKRVRTRYVMSNKVASSSSLSFAAYPCSSSVSEAELEQHEAAISLMMLSRDVNPWWGGLNSVAESSENNNSLHLELEAPNSVPKIERKRLINSVSSNLNSKGWKSSELLGAETLKNGSRLNKTRGFVKNVKGEKPECAFEVNDKYTSSMKAKFLGTEVKLKSLENKGSEGELSCKNTHKRGKFECTTCNKIFHSYQALGGHRASHKRTKGSFASKVESSENNSIELEAAEAETYTDPDLTTESKLMMKKHELGASFDDESKKSKEHECPIRLKVFQSDQALGRHKRSHLAGESENSTSHSETVPEIRDFLDLNLPAATEEGSNSHCEPFRPWWIVKSNHKQEALEGLMSN